MSWSENKMICPNKMVLNNKKHTKNVFVSGDLQNCLSNLSKCVQYVFLMECDDAFAKNMFQFSQKVVVRELLALCCLSLTQQLQTKTQNLKM